MEDSLSYLGNLLRRYKRIPLPEGVGGGGGGKSTSVAEEIEKNILTRFMCPFLDM